jgi:hypothetical protein
MSVICFVIANVIRDNSIVFYYLLLVLGLGLFVLGLPPKKKKIISYFFRLLIINHRNKLKIGTLKFQFSVTLVLSLALCYLILFYSLPFNLMLQCSQYQLYNVESILYQATFGKHVLVAIAL